MRTITLWKQFLIVCLFLILFAGCAPAASDTPEPTSTIKPTITPLPFVEGTKFPTGKFEHVGGHWIVEFREDGTEYWYSTRQLGDGNAKYGVNGNLYSSMQFSYTTGRQLPGTYYWSYDGEFLTFQVWGEDLRPTRWGSTHGQTYRFIGEAEPSSIKDKVEFPTGRFTNEDGLWVFDFNDDGTWSLFEEDLEQPVRSGKYVTNGKYFTEMTHDAPNLHQTPATYIWTYDDQNLTFELWGEDVINQRKSVYEGQTYTQVDE
jgi:hypothetical protein